MTNLGPQLQGPHVRGAAVFWMRGSEVLMVFSTVLITLCKNFQSETLQAPDQTEIQLVSMLSIVPL